jgi:outer membrane protein OmpA-like peptidoglycan-associated protein
MTMKQLHNLFLYALTAICVALPATHVAAQRADRMSEYEQELYGASAHVTADYETTRNIRRYWEQEVLRLKHSGRSGYDFALVGSGESVLRITMPSDIIFVPGDSALATTSDSYLFPLVRLLRGDEAVASVIISCYSDNNGSERYLERMTAARASTVARWMTRQGVPAAQISHYGLAGRVPRTDNSTMRKREQNRRVTLYLVPNKRLLKMAKKGNFK